MKKKKYRITYRPMIAPKYVIKNPDEIFDPANIEESTLVCDGKTYTFETEAQNKDVAKAFLTMKLVSDFMGIGYVKEMVAASIAGIESIEVIDVE